MRSDVRALWPSKYFTPYVAINVTVRSADV